MIVVYMDEWLLYALDKLYRCRFGLWLVAAIET